MTEDILRLRRGLEQEILDVEQRMKRAYARATNTVSSTDGQPHGTGVSDKVGDGAIEIAYLNELHERLVADKIERDRYIDGFADSEVRRAMRYHYIDGMTWRQIGWRMHYSHEGIRQKVYEAIKCHNGDIC